MRSFAALAAAAALLAVLASFFAADGPSKDAAWRRYQNPPQYVQIADSIDTHGFGYYTAPVLVNRYSTGDDHIEAMIRTAFRYEGDPYLNRHSGRPGKGVDCSGLVMQACYGAGVDLWPSNPYRHLYGEDRYEWESREIAAMDSLRTVPFENRKRGDLLFYAKNSDPSDTVVHVAIYLGGGRIIHSFKEGVRVTAVDYNPKSHVCMVKRIFN